MASDFDTKIRRMTNSIFEFSKTGQPSVMDNQELLWVFARSDQPINSDDGVSGTQAKAATRPARVFTDIIQERSQSRRKAFVTGVDSLIEPIFDDDKITEEIGIDGQWLFYLTGRASTTDKAAAALRPDCPALLLKSLAGEREVRIRRNVARN
ncbi:MAG: hypothetical protein K8F91_11205, partial [Candidatus Obscuribacterales bacterium]|nr:hypothetical protein [Candidatus Obscuribacterales bacterium]